MKRFIQEFIEFMTEIIAYLIVLTFIIVSVAYLFVEISCSSYSEVTGKETKTKILSCYVKHDNKFMRWDEYKAYITANGIKED